ncbi:hypothetical protein [Intestinimonas butyriciproducens]|uniref:hypothetical protein n=1 Tax=Intestinimonas butyriciproducens TaxID=1297617 RepID=UPI00195C2F1A|nr:hypothetical protein [Intestinimonas butyriciproducens]MBM6917668.1 hypothetical protein [Intestinimonas butyriciproducens]
MGDKKHLGRFTVQFNLGDPQQARTAEILEQQGRQKARFISTAVLHYINCSETPEVVLPPAPNTAEIEKIVLAVLKKHTAEDGVSASPHRPQPQESVIPSGRAPEPEIADAEDLKELLGDGGFSAIANTLASFGQK